MKLRPEEIVPLERPAETDTGIFSRGDSLIRNIPALYECT